MVVIFKFESKWGEREIEVITKEKSLLELFKNLDKIELILNEFMRKSERLIGIEEEGGIK